MPSAGRDAAGRHRASRSVLGLVHAYGQILSRSARTTANHIERGSGGAARYLASTTTELPSHANATLHSSHL